MAAYMLRLVESHNFCGIFVAPNVNELWFLADEFGNPSEFEYAVLPSGGITTFSEGSDHGSDLPGRSDYSFPPNKEAPVHPQEDNELDKALTGLHGEELENQLQKAASKFEEAMCENWERAHSMLKTLKWPTDSWHDLLLYGEGLKWKPLTFKECP